MSDNESTHSSSDSEEEQYGICSSDLNGNDENTIFMVKPYFGDFNTKWREAIIDSYTSDDYIIVLKYMYIERRHDGYCSGPENHYYSIYKKPRFSITYIDHIIITDKADAVIQGCLYFSNKEHEMNDDKWAQIESCCYKKSYNVIGYIYDTKEDIIVQKNSDWVKFWEYYDSDILVNKRNDYIKRKKEYEEREQKRKEEKEKMEKERKERELKHEEELKSAASSGDTITQCHRCKYSFIVPAHIERKLVSQGKTGRLCHRCLQAHTPGKYVPPMRRKQFKY